MVGVAGLGPCAAAAEIERPPPEDRAVERLRAFRVARVERVEVERAVLVHDRRALVLLRLPDAEDRALRVAEDRHAPRIHDVERVHDDLAAGGLDLLGGGVGAVDPDVGVPERHRRRALGL